MKYTSVLTHTKIRISIFSHRPRVNNVLAFNVPPFGLSGAMLDRQQRVFATVKVSFRLGYRVNHSVAFDSLASRCSTIFVNIKACKVVQTSLPRRSTPNIVRTLPFLATRAHRLVKLPRSRRCPLASIRNGQIIMLNNNSAAVSYLQASVHLGTTDIAYTCHHSRIDVPNSHGRIIGTHRRNIRFRFGIRPRCVTYSRSKHLATINLVHATVNRPKPSNHHHPHPMTNSRFRLPTSILVVTFNFRTRTVP